MIGVTMTSQRIPAPPKEPTVRVEAVTTNWLHQGVPVTQGRVYEVLASAAQTLEYAGKAKRI
jgi:hypothetical protein